MASLSLANASSAVHSASTPTPAFSSSNSIISTSVASPTILPSSSAALNLTSVAESTVSLTTFTEIAFGGLSLMLLLSVMLVILGFATRQAEVLRKEMRRQREEEKSKFGAGWGTPRPEG